MTSDEYLALAETVRQHRMKLEIAERQIRSFAYRAAQPENALVSTETAVAKVLRGYADDQADLVNALHTAARHLLLHRRASDRP